MSLCDLVCLVTYILCLCHYFYNIWICFCLNILNNSGTDVSWLFFWKYYNGWIEEGVECHHFQPSCCLILLARLWLSSTFTSVVVQDASTQDNLLVPSYPNSVMVEDKPEIVCHIGSLHLCILINLNSHYNLFSKYNFILLVWFVVHDSFFCKI